MLVNGEEMLFGKITVQALLEHLKLNKDRVVVEVNLKIIKSDEYGNTWLEGSDSIEIVSFVGGG